MVAVEQNQPATLQNANEPVRDAPKLLNPVQQSQFLAHGGSLNNFRNCEGLRTKTLGRFCTSLLLCFVVQCRFFGSHVGRGRQLVGVWSERHIRSAKIKTAKISFEESGRISAKFCTSENFPLYGI